MSGRRIRLSEAMSRREGNVVFHPLVTPWTVGSRHLMMAELEIDPEGVLPEHGHGSSEVAI